MKTKAKIIVCCHKQEDFIWNSEVYMPLHCGAALSNERLDMQRDDAGENISRKNRNWCELTGLYWAWKNLPKDIDIAGLNHYRRYFDFSPRIFKRNIYRVTTGQFRHLPVQTPDLDSLFPKYDIIIHQPRTVPLRLYDHASINSVSCVDMDLLTEVISELTPDYSDAFDRIMKTTNKESQYCMFIAKRQVFDIYCQWLFTVLEGVESRINISHYRPYRARIYGFIGEFMLRVFVEKNKLKTGYVPVLYVTDEEKQESDMVYLLRKIRNQIIFKSLYSGLSR
ncbi:MAG: DUF4422 domain-containing protein [Dysgonamonadaceae bacterium]|jgi:hypothetical protein|nr:DUF4422 domain-containing protein [Dysgonamonadaceae bacterium]